MARHGENIRKRKDGRWEARYQMQDAIKGRKTYRSVYGSTYEEVKKKRSDALRAAEKTGKDEGEQPTEANDMSREQIPFSQAANEWLEEVSRKRKHSTYIKYGNIYRIHIDGILGTFSLFGLYSCQMQEKISDHLTEENLSDSIRKSICSIVNQILEFADRKYAINVPALKLPTMVKPERKTLETFSKVELSRLLKCVYNDMDKFKIAILLCLYTGMRLGELCALKWTDFDFKDRTVTVNRTVKRIAVKGHTAKTILMETAPKTETAKRTIPLTDDMVMRLKTLGEGGDYVFGGNKPLEPRTLQYRLQKILKESNVDNRNFHILRHTFATNCVENGMDVKTLSAILGHSNVKITLDRYVHPTMDSKRKQLGRLSDYYGQIRGQAA